MIYITIPESMVYQQQIINGEKRDFFVNPENGSRIDLQEEVKNGLRNMNKGVAKGDKISIYSKLPMAPNTIYLGYTPNNNGAKATEKEVQYCKGRSLQTSAPSQMTGHSAWFQDRPLSKERLEEVMKEREEVSKARRHQDSTKSPKGT